MPLSNAHRRLRISFFHLCTFLYKERYFYETVFLHRSISLQASPERSCGVSSSGEMLHTDMQAFSASRPTNERLFGWWFRIAAPPDVPADAPLQKRESVRIGKLTSLALLIEFIYITIVVGVGLTNNRALLPILIGNYVAIIAGVILNHMGRTRLAAVVAFLTLEAGMILNIMNVSAAGGFSTFNLSLLDILEIGRAHV